MPFKGSKKKYMMCMRLQASWRIVSKLFQCTGLDACIWGMVQCLMFIWGWTFYAHLGQLWNICYWATSGYYLLFPFTDHKSTAYSQCPAGGKVWVCIANTLFLIVAPGIWDSVEMHCCQLKWSTSLGLLALKTLTLKKPQKLRLNFPRSNVNTGNIIILSHDHHHPHCDIWTLKNCERQDATVSSTGGRCEWIVYCEPLGYRDLLTLLHKHLKSCWEVGY